MARATSQLDQFALELGRTLMGSETVAAIATDAAGRIVDWAGAAERMFGYEREQVLGAELAETIVPATIRRVHRDAFMAYLATGEASTQRRFEQTGRRADGAEFPIELTLLRVSESEPPLVAVIVRDITSARQTQIRLARSEALLAEAEELASSGSFDYDLRGQGRECSAGLFRLLGLPPGEPPALARLFALVHPEDRAVMRHRFEHVIRDLPATFEETCRIVAPGGAERVVSLHGKLVLDELGVACRVVGTARDVSDEWRARRTRDLHSYVVESSADAILTNRNDGTITSWNAGAERLYGYSAAEAIGRPVEMLAPPRLAAEQAMLTRRVFAGESIRHQQAERVRKDGTVLLVSLTISPVRDPSGRIVSAAVVARDVTERRRLEQRLRHLADHDPLTGLLNRRRFEEELRQELARAGRSGNGGAVLSIDLDQFKEVNDAGGHAAGDALLCEVARTLRRQLRETDLPARLGGDEFAVLLPGTTGDGARTAVGNLLAALRAAVVEVDEVPLRITASIGGVEFRGSELGADELLIGADLAMYEAKRQGRDQTVIYSAEQARDSRAGAHVSWSRRIRDAIDHDGLVLHWQPIVSLRDGRVAQGELLLRMRRDDALLAPAAFLGAAERLGLIHAIDRWVVRRAIAMLASGTAPSSVPLSINLSAESVGGDGELFDLIVGEVRRTGVSPTDLIFELTETAAVANMAQARAFVEGVRDLGCRVALDDFGTGFGSFLYLKHLPVDFIKIDREFIDGLPGSDIDCRLVRSIVDVAQGLGVGTIAEAVGGAETVDLLRGMGIDYAQGYHVGIPVPVEG